MKRKSPKQRAIEFVNSYIVKKNFKNLVLSSDDLVNLEKFFNIYLKDLIGEVPNSIYGTLGNLLTYQPSKDLYECYQNTKKYKTGTLNHYTALFGIGEGTNRFSKKRKLVSNNNKLSDNNKVDAFLNKKCVSSILRKDEMSTYQLKELKKLLLSDEYSKFNDNEAIIIDLILNFCPDFITRYNKVKSSPHNSIEYFRARYAHNCADKYQEYVSNKRKGAVANFPNCKDYWILKGLTTSDAEEQANIIQRQRANKSKLVTKGTLRARSIEFWISRGYSVKDATNTVRLIQTRDLQFFINQYGEDEGHYKFQQMIQKRIAAWYGKDINDQRNINKSKGRTYSQLVDTFGVDATNEIMSARLTNATGISAEANRFFETLDLVVRQQARCSLEQRMNCLD